MSSRGKFPQGFLEPEDEQESEASFWKRKYGELKRDRLTEEADQREERRFQAACAAMQHLVIDAWHGSNTQVVSKLAVQHADALLAELGRTKEAQ